MKDFIIPGVADIRFASARYHLGYAADSCMAAYWTHDEMGDYHANEAVNHLRKAAAELGFDIVERESPASALVETLSEATP